MGVPDTFNTLSARALARQALLQSNQQYLTVMQEVRSSYLNMLTAREQVKVAAEAVVSATEQLRLANLRVAYGQGINLELIQAQQAYVTALTNHVQAVIAYNISQAQLLRDSGQISVETLTKEIKQPISMKP
ncbi:MAG: Outer membrane efflux protein [bacterium ADurb.Bin425]|nr:MAG: Outer membrane efflux protein [bacterium ADurb.Bin425]